MNKDENILHLVSAFEECFEDVIVAHELTVLAAPHKTGPLFELLQQARTMCLPIREEIAATRCLECDHFVGCRKNADGTVSVQCWGHERRLARGTEQMSAVKLH